MDIASVKPSSLNLKIGNNSGDINIMVDIFISCFHFVYSFWYKKGYFDFDQFCLHMIILTQVFLFSHMEDINNVLKSIPIFVCMIFLCLFVRNFPRVPVPNWFNVSLFCIHKTPSCWWIWETINYHPMIILWNLFRSSTLSAIVSISDGWYFLLIGCMVISLVLST